MCESHVYSMLFLRERCQILYLITMQLQTLLKNTSRSLYLSVQALPPSMRPAFSVAYLLCRYADTVADTQVLPAGRRLYWVERFARLVQTHDMARADQLAGELSGGSDNPYEQLLITQLRPCLHWLSQIPAAQQPLIWEVVASVCEGMRRDLTFFPSQPAAQPKALATAHDLEQYCHLMGGKPGLFWSKLIYSTCKVAADEQTFYTWGQAVGDALQIVNILRDLPRDLQIGRCYFPQEDLQTAGLTAPDLLNPQNSRAFEPVKQKWIAWGLERLASAKAYFAQLPKTQPGQRAAVAWPVLWTADTLYRVAQTPDLLNPHKRVKISRRVIYSTMALTPLLWVSNRFFGTWLSHKLRKFSRRA